MFIKNLQKTVDHISNKIKEPCWLTFKYRFLHYLLTQVHKVLLIQKPDRMTLVKPNHFTAFFKNLSFINLNKITWLRKKIPKSKTILYRRNNLFEVGKYHHNCNPQYLKSAVYLYSEL